MLRLISLVFLTSCAHRGVSVEEYIASPEEMAEFRRLKQGNNECHLIAGYHDPDLDEELKRSFVVGTSSPEEPNITTKFYPEDGTWFRAHITYISIYDNLCAEPRDGNFATIREGVGGIGDFNVTIDFRTISDYDYDVFINGETFKPLK